MKQLLLVSVLAAFFQLGISAQVAVNPVRVVPTDPSGSCPPARIDLSTATGTFFYCDPMSMTWVPIASGGGGSVTQINTTAPIAGGPITTTGTITCDVASGSQPGCLSATDWTTFNGKQAGGVAITSLTGDVTASGPGAAAATIASDAVTTVKILNANVTAAKMVNAGVFTGDVTTTFPAITVAKVNGIAYSATAAAHSVQVTTTANSAVTAKVVPDCTDTGGNHLNFTQSTDAFSCGTSGGSSGVTSIGTTSPITGGTITTTGTIACATCVVASSPGVGIAHFAGSTQTVTSSAVNLAGGANEITGVLPAANAPSGSSVLIQEQVLGGTAASVTFSSIPGTYRNLRLTIQARCNNASTSQDVIMQFNADTGANYSREFSFASGTGTTQAGQTISNANIAIGNMVCANGLANMANATVVDIPNYSGTTFFKSAVSVNGSGGTAASDISTVTTHFLWANTNAITSIKLIPAAGSFIAGSTFDLYAQ